MKSLIRTLYINIKNILIVTSSILTHDARYFQPKNSNSLYLLTLEKSIFNKIKRIINDSESTIHKNSFGINVVSSSNDIVLRISKHKRFQQNNFSALTLLNSNLKKFIPKPLFIYHGQNYIVSGETFVQGNILDANDNKIYFKNNFKQLNEVHKFKLAHKISSYHLIHKYKTLISVRGLMRKVIFKILELIERNVNEFHFTPQLIHGDYTFRNITDIGGMYDFDRCEYALPSFDAIAFFTDLRTHQNKDPSYISWFINIIKLIKNKNEYYSWIEDLNLSKRKYKIDDDIILLFLYRSIYYTFEHYSASYSLINNILLSHGIYSNLNKVLK